MANYTAGSVTAEIKLDTTKFKESIEELKKEMATLKKDFKDISLQSVAKEVDNLKKTVSALKDQYGKFSKKTKESQKDLDKFNESVVKVDKSTQLFRKHFDMINRSTYLGKDIAKPFLDMRRESTKANAALNETTKGVRTAKNSVAQFQGELYKLAKAIKLSNNSITGQTKKYESLANTISKFLLKTDFQPAYGKRANAPIFIDDISIANLKKASQAMATFNRMLKSTDMSTRKLKTMGKIFDPSLKEMEQAGTALNRFTTQTRLDYLNMYKSMSVASQQFYAKERLGMSSYEQRINQVSAALRKSYLAHEQYYASVGAMSWKYWRQVRNSSIQNPKDRLTGESFPQAQYKVQTVGLQDYYKNIERVNKALIELSRNQKIASGQLGSAWKSNGVGLNQYYQNLNKINRELDKQAQKVQRVKNAQLQLQYFQRTDWLNQYKGNMKEINTQLEKQTQNTRNAGRGLTSFNNGVVQTAHSGRILSNTLYQIRGALLSLKMIFTAMGGMALWGFATEIAEGVKETFSAKNEIEAQLRQNKKVDASGIQYFNEQLTELTKTYKKVNKYSIGETVSAIGLEFDLNAKQMAESLDVVSMIQSEYIRAGRKESEAALAVKDILQGEFQRLSRETGVGKEELIAYGWDEDKTNVEGLMNALRKAAKDRHWDIFAKKATSLNDVMTILKSRMNETGADILQSVTPMVVEGFNMIIGAVEWLQKSFNGLGPLWKNLALFGGGGALFTGILTALPMVTKGMGLAQISTIGWAKSLATAALNLNKAEVAQYGFRKALAAVISGTKANDLANIRSTKAIMGRLLGVKQSVLAEKGYMTALVHSKGILKNHTGATNLAKISSMGLAQKVAYLTNNMKLQDAQALGTGKAILKTATSFKVLKMAILGVTGIALVAWFSSVAAQAEQTKKNIEAFNEISASGYDKLADARKQADSYQKIMDKYGEETNQHKQAKANKEIVEGNIKELESATQLVGSYKLQNKEREKNIKLAAQQFRKNNLIAAGNDPAAATEKAAGWTNKIEEAQKAITNSYQKQYDWLESSSKHISENVGNLKAAGANQEELNKYVYEYSAVAEEAGEHLKQFYQGDMSALAYYAWDRLRLAWIDISNHPEVVKLFKTLGNTWKSWQPTLKAISKFLGDIALKLVELANSFLSTEFGQQTALWAALGGAVALVGWKLRGTIGSVKDIVSKFKTLGSKLKDIATKWRNAGDEAEKANDKMGGKDKDTTSTTSTGGINGDVKKGELGKTIGQDARNIARNYAKVAVHLALAMGLVTEAILLLNAPMLALAGTGALFKSIEPQVRDGIEGLKLIAPTVLALLSPMIAFMYVVGRFKISSSTLTQGFRTAAIGVAYGITLVAEAIVLLNAPLISLGILGSVYSGMKNEVDNGIRAIDTVTKSLYALMPWIPVFAVGVVLAAAAFTGIGGMAFLAAALGIATGIVLVTEAIGLMEAPLWAIGQLGNDFKDLSSVQKGADALKIAAEALGYVESAMRDLTLVKWDLLGGYIAQLVGLNIGLNFDGLTGNDGFFSQLNKFLDDFGKVEIKPIDSGKVESVKNAGNGIRTIGEAMKNVANALQNMPDEFKDGNNVFTSYNAETGQTAINATESGSGYFDQFKQPIEELNNFVLEFNKMPIEGPDAAKVEALNQAANMIGSIKTAVENVKNAMGGIADAQWNTGMAEGGIFGAIGSFLYHQTGAGSINNGQSSGDYSSSIGSSLKAMEDVIRDIVTFQSRVSGLGGGNDGNTNVDGLANMVTAVSNAIQQLQTELTNAVPQVKAAAKSIGTGLKDGIKEGMSNLNTDIIQKVTEAMNAAKPYANTYGKGIGDQGKQGVQSGFKIKDVISAELGYALEEMENKKQEFHDKGYALGKASADGFKEGEDSHSPGIIARTMFAEMAYVGQSLDEAIGIIPQKAYALGNALATNFTPQFATDFGLTDMSAFETGLQGISTAATDTNLQATAAFNNMNTTANTSMTGMTNSINGAFNTIQQNTTSRYSQLVNTTRVSLNSMQSQTTKNINAIKTSWRGMQNALIQSAENIRSETGAKIKSLENNMASFWAKVQNPSTLMQSAAGPMGGIGTIRRRSRPSSLRGGSSGGTSRRSYAAGPFKTGKKNTGIATSFGSKSNYGLRIRNLLAEYLSCLSDGGNCAMGSGWSFNWAKDIQDSLLKWHTHFGAIYDEKLTVGKFENDDFPVRGDADIFKNYVYDAIRKTQYASYFDSNFGEDPVAAYNSGHFNCWDGANIVMRLASAFGFSSHRVWGSWDGIPHVWAHVDGVGDIDATAIQGGYGLFASKVRAAGPLKVRNSGKGNTGLGDTHNYGDVNVTINVYGDDVEVNDSKVDKSTAKQIIDLLGVNPATGQ